MRQTSKILAITGDQSAEDFMKKLESGSINYYQALGLESGDFASQANLNAIVTTRVEQLGKAIEVHQNLNEENKEMLLRAIDVLVRHLLDPEKRSVYDAQLVFTPVTEQPARSAPMSPVIAQASPVRSKRAQHELEQLLGGTLEEHRITFTAFLKGSALPSPVSFEGSHQDLSSIKLVDSYKKSDEVNAGELLANIKAISDEKGKYNNILPAVCNELHFRLQDVKSPKQQLWVMLKSKDPMVREIVADAVRATVNDAKKPSSPSPRR